MKKLLSVILTVGMTVSLEACGGSATESTTKEMASEATTTTVAEAETTVADMTTEAVTTTTGDTFTVGFDQDFAPMGFVDDKGEFTGFDIELAKEAAKRMGMELKLQPIAWDSKDMELESGTIDCIWSGFTINGREDAYTWSKPYMDNTQVFVVAKDSGIATLKDLATKTVEVQADSSAEAALKDMPDLTATFGKLQTTPDYNTAFMDLESGAVDAIAMDVIVAGYQIEQRKADFMILDESIASEEYGIGFKLGNEALRDKVQSALDEMSTDGTLKTISEKWFGQDITTVGK